MNLQKFVIAVALALLLLFLLTSCGGTASTSVTSDDTSIKVLTETPSADISHFSVVHLSANDPVYVWYHEPSGLWCFVRYFGDNVYCSAPAGGR